MVGGGGGGVEDGFGDFDGLGRGLELEDVLVSLLAKHLVWAAEVGELL